MRPRWWVWIGLAAVAGVVVAVLALSPARSRLDQPDNVAFGDPERGRDVIAQAGCGACHTIPGVVGADALVGPPLVEWSQRSFIAGNLENNPGNLARWIMDPQAVEPGTAMPDLDLTRQQVEDVVAYLFTLD